MAKIGKTKKINKKQATFLLKFVSKIFQKNRGLGLYYQK
jgi:hypothetical protein